MSVKLLWKDLPQYCDGNGAPYAGAKLFTYAAGSSTKQNTYTTSAGSVANSNPIVLDANGRVPSAVWGTVGQTYKLLLAPSTDTDPPVSPIWTIDNVAPINDTTSAIDQWVAGPAPTYISAASFSLVGDQTSTFHIGRRLKTTNTGGTVYSTISDSSFAASATTVKVLNDSGSLDSGLSAVSYGLLSGTNTALPVGAGFQNDVCYGRLTLETGVAISTSDQTAKTTLYFTPYRGNTIALYDGTKWVNYKFSELSIAVPATTSTMYDVWVYNNSGVLALELTAWTNDTTRATALATQDGVYVKTGSTGRRYVGSFRTTAVSGQTEDSLAKRYVWNYCNRVLRGMSNAAETTNSWTYTTATYRQANANTANQLDYVMGVSEDIVSASVFGTASSDQAINLVKISVGVGVDSTSTNSAQIVHATNNPIANALVNASAVYKGTPGVGRHTLVWLEASTATGTTTWRGDDGSAFAQTGIIGEVRS
jgi:hypothetical protein